MAFFEEIAAGAYKCLEKARCVNENNEFTRKSNINRTTFQNHSLLILIQMPLCHMI